MIVRVGLVVPRSRLLQTSETMFLTGEVDGADSVFLSVPQCCIYVLVMCLTMPLPLCDSREVGLISDVSVILDLMHRLGEIVMKQRQFWKPWTR